MTRCLIISFYLETYAKPCSMVYSDISALVGRCAIVKYCAIRIMPIMYYVDIYIVVVCMVLWATKYAV